MSWLVTAISPTSMATKTAASRPQGTLDSRGRIHTSTIAPAQKARAMSVAFRTVEATSGLTGTPANTCTSAPVAVSAHSASAPTMANGTRATTRSKRVVAPDRAGTSSVRSSQPANNTTAAVATVIMFRLWRRWFPYSGRLSNRCSSGVFEPRASRYPKIPTAYQVSRSRGGIRLGQRGCHRVSTAMTGRMPR